MCINLTFYLMFHIKNINCFDSNDKMRFRRKLLFSNGSPAGWSSWGTLEASYFHGCVNEFSTLYKPQDIYEVESTKNGLINTYIDTFNIALNDTLKIYY